MDYAARKWPGITWLLDHMSYPYPPGDMSAGADLGNHNVTFILRLSIPRRVVCVVRTISAMIVRTGKDNWAGYRPVLDLARHPNIMYASLPESSGESGAAVNLGEPAARSCPLPLRLLCALLSRA